MTIVWYGSICNAPHSAALDAIGQKLTDSVTTREDVDAGTNAMAAIKTDIEKYGVKSWCRATGATMIKTLETIGQRYL